MRRQGQQQRKWGAYIWEKNVSIGGPMHLCTLHPHKSRSVVFPGLHHDSGSKQGVSQPQNRPRDGDAVGVDQTWRGAKSQVDIAA